MRSFLFIGGSICIALLLGCAPKNEHTPKDEQYLHQQEKEQGYPVLIATPEIANYGLPFCEKKYCLEVEIFSFKSQDEWFNQFVDQKISDLIRLQLDLTQKLSLQKAVNEFVRLSDEWQEEHSNQPWSMYIQPRVASQYSEITLLQVQSEYVLGDLNIPKQVHYFVVDRNLKKEIKLYDVINENNRVAFGEFLQTEYQKWLAIQIDKTDLPEKVYWANQDWFFDEQGIAIYYRQADLNPNLEYKNENLTIYLPTEKLQLWLKKEYLLLFGLLKTTI